MSVRRTLQKRRLLQCPGQRQRFLLETWLGGGGPQWWPGSLLTGAPGGKVYTQGHGCRPLD